MVLKILNRQNLVKLRNKMRKFKLKIKRMKNNLLNNKSNKFKVKLKKNLVHKVYFKA